MHRRDFLKGSAAAAGIAAGWSLAGAAAGGTGERAGGRLTPPKDGKLPVAVTISEGVTVIDFSGPWEVFQDVHIPEAGDDMEKMMPFRLFTVAESLDPVRGSGGLRLVPDYTFANAPSPRIVVVPAQKGNAALHEWLRKTSNTADLTMSVCTGAFQLAKAGLLSGLEATTHHDFLDRLAGQYPDVKVKRGLRFVEGAPKIATAGGLSSGIDLALRVVERYYGRPAAERTAAYMEYQSKGWIV
ncbi:MAG: DJ-1/PfpI family protein [Acidobacteriota bacterium]|nr:DJ-1/PfpI family protein [Acidobacteriota bacterium]